MEAYKTPVNVLGLGFTAIILGLLGAAFYWWTPMGIVLSLSGCLLGFIGWTFARRKTANFGLVIAGMLISLAGLVLDSVIAILGLEIIKFQALQ